MGQPEKEPNKEEEIIFLQARTSINQFEKGNYVVDINPKFIDPKTKRNINRHMKKAVDLMFRAVVNNSLPKG